MSFLLVLACTVVLTVLLKDALRKHPTVFYAGAIVLTVLYIGNLYVAYPGVVRSVLFLLMQKCTLSLALFVVVMYIGVFRKDSKVGLALRPIRAELSILACILCLGHVCVYLIAFAPRFFGGDGWLSAFLLTAVALLILLLVLGVTSFSRVKRRMGTAFWVKLQKWAYVFFGLIYAHLVIILLPSALAQGTTAVTSVVIYTGLFGLYAILRARRAIVDSKVSSVHRFSRRSFSNELPHGEQPKGMTGV